jgi:hypothetical protein
MEFIKNTFRSKDIPDLCIDSKIDAITELSDGRWLAFKDQHYYELSPFSFKVYSSRKIK